MLKEYLSAEKVTIRNTKIMKKKKKLTGKDKQAVKMVDQSLIKLVGRLKGKSIKTSISTVSS